MNYLAHALLSPADDLVLMGNLWGDLLKPRDYAALPDGMMRGILLHRHIDRFTDSHPDIAAIRNLLRPAQGKYTPVVADVLMDYILSRTWADFHDVLLETFCVACYRIVEVRLHLIPPGYHHRLHRMLEHRWLESCASRERMTETLKMLGGRAAFSNEIPRALEVYDRCQSEIDALFIAFFRALQANVSLQNEG